MLDLVSKAVVVRDLVAYQHECFSTIGHEETFNAINHIIKGVMDMPTVGATPVKHGHWEDYLKSGLKYRCSFCKSRFNTAWEYCPHCGAKMHSGAELDEVTQ